MYDRKITDAYQVDLWQVTWTSAWPTPFLSVYFALFMTVVVGANRPLPQSPFSLAARGIMWTTRLWVTSLTGRVRTGTMFDPSCCLGREDFKKISSELEARRKAKVASAEIT